MSANSEDGFRIASANQVLASTAERQAAAKALESGAVSLGASGPKSSTADVAATSEAIATASDHLDRVLKEENWNIKTSHISFAKYLEKVQMVPQHELPENFPESELSPLDWSLVEISAQVSASIYISTLQARPEFDYKIIEPSGGKKSTIVRVADWDGKRVLVVGVQGTVTKGDWMLDANSAPSNELPGSPAFHSGFLKATQLLEPDIIKHIQEFHEKGPLVDSLLFTGHSLGGAIAQILYFFAFTNSSPLYEALADLKTTWPINCITFGTPPVSSTRIRPQKGSKLLSIINEGDLVTLAQENYVHQLLEIYALSPENVKAKVKRGFAVPAPFYKTSGSCVVLREKKGDDDKDIYTACDINAEQLEQAFFGDPEAHKMQNYLERVKVLRAAKTRVAKE